MNLISTLAHLPVYTARTKFFKEDENSKLRIWKDPQGCVNRNPEKTQDSCNPTEDRRAASRLDPKPLLIRALCSIFLLLVPGVGRRLGRGVMILALEQQD